MADGVVLGFRVAWREADRSEIVFGHRVAGHRAVVHSNDSVGRVGKLQDSVTIVSHTAGIAGGHTRTDDLTSCAQHKQGPVPQMHTSQHRSASWACPELALSIALHGQKHQM